MKRIKGLLVASSVLIAGVMLMTIAWELIFPGKIYHCMDEVGPGFLEPGRWVHGPIAVVEKIDTLRGMSEPDVFRGGMVQPDVIKVGWSEKGLWTVWWSMVMCVVLATLASPRLVRIQSTKEASKPC